MCPARVIIPQGPSFILKEKEELGKHSPFFHDLPFKDKTNLIGWLTIKGTRRGFKIHVWGKIDKTIFVSPNRVSSSPPGNINAVKLGKGNTYTLEGGTKVVPFH